MANNSDSPIFLDTNILVYASIPESPFHLLALNAIQSRQEAGSDL